MKRLFFIAMVLATALLVLAACAPAAAPTAAPAAPAATSHGPHSRALTARRSYAKSAEGGQAEGTMGRRDLNEKTGWDDGYGYVAYVADALGLVGEDGDKEVGALAAVALSEERTDAAALYNDCALPLIRR